MLYYFFFYYFGERVVHLGGRGGGHFLESAGKKWYPNKGIKFNKLVRTSRVQARQLTQLPNLQQED